MQNDSTNRQGRLFLALFLSLAVWMGINYIFFPPQPPKPKAVDEAAKTEGTEKEKQQMPVQKLKSKRQHLNRQNLIQSNQKM